jgi:hypothetical protein
MVDRVFTAAQSAADRDFRQQLEGLQIELLKMQGWVKDTNQRVAILFEGATRPARAAPSRGSPSASTLAAPGSSAQQAERARSRAVVFPALHAIARRRWGHAAETLVSVSRGEQRTRKDESVVRKPDPLLVGPASEVYEKEERVSS